MTIQNATMVKVFAPATLNEGDTFDAVVDGIVFQARVPAGGVREGQSFQVPHPNQPKPQTMVKVFAPSTLSEGASFDAVVDGIVFKAIVPAGGVREGQSFQVPHPNQPKPQKMVKVIAPATLAEGATFDSVVDGIVFQVKVPAGGVNEGQSMQVPYPSKVQKKTNNKRATNSNKDEDGWRYGLCDCCSNGNILMTLMGIFCPWVLNAQMIERMGLNIAGFPRKNAADNPKSMVCQIQLGVLAILLVVFIICYFFIPRFAGIVQLLLSAWLVFLFVAQVCLRKKMREHYDLPGVCCGDGVIDDCCVSYWCQCCSLVQMASQTHDPEEYKYDCCTSTGLGPDAPSCHIV